MVYAKTNGNLTVRVMQFCGKYFHWTSNSFFKHQIDYLFSLISLINCIVRGTFAN